MNYALSTNRSRVAAAFLRVMLESGVRQGCVLC